MRCSFIKWFMVHSDSWRSCIDIEGWSPMFARVGCWKLNEWSKINTFGQLGFQKNTKCLEHAPTKPKAAKRLGMPFQQTEAPRKISSLPDALAWHRALLRWFVFQRICLRELTGYSLLRKYWDVIQRVYFSSTLFYGSTFAITFTGHGYEIWLSPFQPCFAFKNKLVTNQQQSTIQNQEHEW